MPGTKPERRISVADGKYEFIIPSDDWRVHVLRYGEPWIKIESGHNAVAALMSELIERTERDGGSGKQPVDTSGAGGIKTGESQFVAVLSQHAELRRATGSVGGEVWILRLWLGGAVRYNAELEITEQEAQYLLKAEAQAPVG